MCRIEKTTDWKAIRRWCGAGSGRLRRLPPSTYLSVELPVEKMRPDQAVSVRLITVTRARNGVMRRRRLDPAPSIRRWCFLKWQLRLQSPPGETALCTFLIAAFYQPTIL